MLRGYRNRRSESCDLWLETLFKSPLESQRRFPAQQVTTFLKCSHCLNFDSASDLRFAENEERKEERRKEEKQPRKGRKEKGKGKKGERKGRKKRRKRKRLSLPSSSLLILPCLASAFPRPLPPFPLLHPPPPPPPPPSLPPRRNKEKRRKGKGKKASKGERQRKWKERLKAGKKGVGIQPNSCPTRSWPTVELKPSKISVASFFGGKGAKALWISRQKVPWIIMASKLSSLELSGALFCISKFRDSDFRAPLLISCSSQPTSILNTKIPEKGSPFQLVSLLCWKIASSYWSRWSYVCVFQEFSEMHFSTSRTAFLQGLPRCVLYHKMSVIRPC